MRDPDHALALPRREAGVDAVLREIGDWLMRNQRAIRATQWIVVVAYLALLVAPTLLPLPSRTAHLWTNLTLFAQFVFWGLWWPFVLLSTVLVGRMWCGLLCPEGAITEAVSQHSRGLAIPRWMRWKGWPFVAFAATTIYGQMISVYQYPKPALVILGFSTVAAIATALLWGRNKRVWCRFLCPVTGVFAVLAKLAPLHFRVDSQAWDSWRKPHPRGPAQLVNCAPLVPIRTMKGGSACHMCGRCSGYRGAVTLARRSPNHEIVHVAGSDPRPMETMLILFGLLGIAAAAFHWSGSAIYVEVKQTLAEWLVDHGVMWPLETVAPWWILTNYPDLNDVMTLLDGAVLLGYILVMAIGAGGAVAACVALSTRLLGRWSSARFHHLVQSLIPLAACGVFLGLSMTTVSLLRNDGIVFSLIGPLRAAMLIGAGVWSLWLGWQIAGLYGSAARRVVALLPLIVAVAASGAVWARLFWSL
ncbi:MAG: 4Fe-4S binding protein [Rhodopseudomonas sp.]|uniref:4Fe-4S binding protein n=1 Tax=Rhodopseudomonas sp. TaxID=1078 RepID=UPI001853750C|nr:4Fe-4S binding protein [Rhodopseudomonas sp.]NVN88691.1 4Fe-4S binding protein [Rhodopseudomonas sp.]